MIGSPGDFLVFCTMPILGLRKLASGIARVILDIAGGGISRP